MARGSNKKIPVTWLVDLGNNVPKFEDVFDETTFYWTAFAVVISSFLLAYFVSRRVTLRPVDF